MRKCSYSRYKYQMQPRRRHYYKCVSPETRKICRQVPYFRLLRASSSVRNIMGVLDRLDRLSALFYVENASLRFLMIKAFEAFK